MALGPDLGSALAESPAYHPQPSAHFANMRTFRYRNWLTCLLLWIFTAQIMTAQAPLWWANQNVLIGEADDFAAINQGQLKNLALAAVVEMDAKMASVGGAGQELRAMVNQWLAQDTESDDFAVVTLGQLKAVALLFHQRLQQVGSLPSLPSWLTQQQDNYAVANIGQAKQAFAFALPTTGVESGYGSQNNGLSTSNSPNASGDAPNSSVAMSSRTRAANPSSSLLSPTTANLTALGLGYGVTCANAQWVPEARLNLHQNPAIVADPPTLPYPYSNPRHIVTTDHWMALQADYDVSQSSVLLFKRSSASHAWKLDKAEKVLSPLGAKSTLLTNYGMNIAIDEQPNGVVTLAITSARVGAAEEAIAIDLWRYEKNTWRSELPGTKCIVPHPLVFAEDVEGMHFEHQDWIAAKASESIFEFNNFASFGATLCLHGDCLFVASPQARRSSWLNSWFNSPNGYLQLSNTARPNDSAIPVRSGTGIVSCFRRKVSGTMVQWYLHETLDPTFYNKFRQQAPRSEALSPTEVIGLLQGINYGQQFLNPSNMSGTLWYYPATYGFGSAITVNMNTIAISGMSRFGEAQDIVWVASHSISDTGYFQPVRPPDSATPSLLAAPDRHFGKSLAFVGNQLAVGASCEREDGFAPDSQPSGRIYRYEKYADSSWHMAGFQEGAAGDTGFGSTIGVAQGNLWTLSGSPLGNSESALLTFSYNDTFAQGPGTETTPLHLDALVANLGQADFSGFDPQHLRPSHPTCGETSFRLTFPGQEAYYAGTLRHAAQIDLQAPASPLFRLDFATPRQSLALSFPDGPLALATGKKFTATPIAASSQGYFGHTSWLIGPASSTASDTAKLLKDGFTLLRCVATSRQRVTADTVPLAIYKEPAVSKWLKLDGVVDSAGTIHVPPRIRSLEGLFRSLMEKWHKLGILIPVWSSGSPWSNSIETSNTMPSKHPYEWPAWPGNRPPAGLHYVLQMHDDTMPISPIDEDYWSTVADGLTITERMQVRPRTSGTTRTILYRVLLVNGFGNLLRTSNIWTVPWDNDNDGLPNWFELKHGPRVNGNPSATAMTPDGTDFNSNISNVDVFQRGLENTNGSGSAVSYQLEAVQGKTSPDATNPPQLRFLGRAALYGAATDPKNHPFTGELKGDPNFSAHEEGSSGNYSAEMSAKAQAWRDFQLADRKELVTTQFLLDLNSGNWDDAKSFTTVYSDWRDPSAAESALLDRAGVDVKQQVRPREGNLDAVHEEQSFITLRKVGNDPNTPGTSNVHKLEMLLLDQTWDLTEPLYQFYKWFDNNSLQLASVDDVIKIQPGSNSRAYPVVFEFNGDSASGHPSNIIVPNNAACLVGTLPGGGKFLRLGSPPEKYQLHKVSLLHIDFEDEEQWSGLDKLSPEKWLMVPQDGSNRAYVLGGAGLDMKVIPDGSYISPTPSTLTTNRDLISFGKGGIPVDSEGLAFGKGNSFGSEPLLNFSVKMRREIKVALHPISLINETGAVLETPQNTPTAMALQDYLNKTFGDQANVHCTVTVSAGASVNWDVGMQLGGTYGKKNQVLNISNPGLGQSEEEKVITTAVHDSSVDFNVYFVAAGGLTRPYVDLGMAVSDEVGGGHWSPVLGFAGKGNKSNNGVIYVWDFPVATDNPSHLWAIAHEIGHRLGNLGHSTDSFANNNLPQGENELRLMTGTPGGAKRATSPRMLIHKEWNLIHETFSAP